MPELEALAETAGWPDNEPTTIYESDVFPELPGPWVACEQGENECTGGDYTAWMKYHDDGWICWPCYWANEQICINYDLTRRYG